MLNAGATAILATVVANQSQNDNFFPLTVNYQERAYAAGRFPGGFFKREARPSEKEVLTSRLIDRPLRPLFPIGFNHEVQIICTVMSSDKNNDPDIFAMIAASAALAVSGLPFLSPMGAARVALLDEDRGYVLNPDYSTLKDSALDMVVAGTQSAILMVESAARELDEDVMLGAMLYAHQQMQVVIKAIEDFATALQPQSFAWQAPVTNQELVTAVREEAEAAIMEAYRVGDKQARYRQLEALRAQVEEKLGDNESDNFQLNGFIHDLEKNVVRKRILDGELRIDGRDNETVRPISIELGILPNTHGSALFTRGETQVIVTTTLGSKRNAQMIDALEGEYFDNFMLHYNFPPYCVGEIGFMGAPKRREIGHGRLAKRGIFPMLPKQDEDFPYTIRVVSEVTESNGSSSMATTCGASLALMDAGVPIQKAVAGVAMGLVKDDQGRFAVLTDILGDEDHLGDMDFKVAGTQDGVTALQMDMKVQGITEQILEQALQRAQVARLQILQQMQAVIAAPRKQVADHAPTVLKMQIKPDKVRDVIGKGGSKIRSITEETSTEINLEQDGSVHIYCDNRKNAEEAQFQIRAIACDPEVGEIFDGVVERITDFGAFVSILRGYREGLVHISQITDSHVKRVEDHLEIGGKVRVRIIGIDHLSRIRLSIKAVNANYPS